MPRPEQFFIPHQPEPLLAPHTGSGDGGFSTRKQRRAAQRQQVKAARNNPSLLTRRNVILGVGGLGAVVLMTIGSGNSPSPAESTASPSASRPTTTDGMVEVARISQEQVLANEVGRLASAYPPESFVRAVYLGPSHEEINPVFTLPVTIGHETEVRQQSVTTASTFVDTKRGVYDETKKFAFIPGKDNKVLTHVPCEIRFSKDWLGMKSDRAKEFIMVKEALHLSIISNIGYAQLDSNRRAYGREVDSVPGITDEQKAITLAMDYVNDPERALILDFAAYLFMLSKFEDYQNSDPEFAKEMAEGDISSVLLKEAKARGINYRSTDFLTRYKLAFEEDSPWRKMINELQFRKYLRDVGPTVSPTRR